MSTIIKTLKNKTGTDLSGYDRYPVKFDTDGIVLCTAKADQPVGVLKKGGVTNSDVVIFGECFALCAGTVTGNGKMVTPGSAGVQDTSGTSTEFAFAIEAGSATDAVLIFVLGSPLKQA